MSNIFPLPGSLIFVACLLTPVAAFPRQAGVEITGPVSAQVIRVIDGDTLLVDASPWPNHHVEVYVRLRGIDAPEIRSSCATVRSAAQRAQRALEEMTGKGGTVALMRISGDKYFARVVADVIAKGGRNPANEMLSSGYVGTYDGGRKHKQVCASGTDTDPKI